MLVSSVLGLAIASQVATAGGLELIGKLSDPDIRETSGIVASRKHPGIFWILSDSGNLPIIHAIRRDGRVIASVRVAIPNLDWEDIATDDAGHLFIGEIGNNGHLFPIRAVYQVDEPDPAAPPKAAIPVGVATFYRFVPGLGRFDAESLYVFGTRLYVIAKRRDGKLAEQFVLEADRTSPGKSRWLAEPVGALPGFVEPATGADLSTDGKRLAVCSTEVTRVYDRTDRGVLSFRGEVRYKPIQIEAITWDGANLLLASEAGELFRIAEATWSGSRKAAP